MKGSAVSAIQELIWNSLDAEATRVEVVLGRNEMKGVNSVLVRDNGSGIDHDRALVVFKKVGGSWKRDYKKPANSRDLHGKAGKGRLVACGLGTQVEWRTKFAKGDQILAYSITSDRWEPQEFDISDPRITTGSTGTEVYVTHIEKKSSEFTPSRIIQALTQEYATYLMRYHGIELVYEGTVIDPMELVQDQKVYDLEPFRTPDNREFTGHVLVVEWTKDMDRRISLCDENQFPLREIPIGIHAPGFSFTAYVSSPLIRTLDEEGNLVEMHPATDAIIDAVKTTLRQHFKERAKERAASLLETWRSEGTHPFPDPPRSSIERNEQELYDVIALSVVENLPELQTMEKRSRRIILTFLKQSIEAGESELHQIVENVLGLTQQQKQALIEVLKKTTLPRLINASRTVIDRLDILSGIKTLVWDTPDVLERRNLHKILELHPWIFGEQFNLSASDVGLTKVLRHHLKEFGMTPPSLAKVRRIDGSTGIVDLMFSTVYYPRPDEREHLVVELKKPRHRLNNHDADQIESYAHAVAEDKRFHHDKTNWVFWLVSDEMDVNVRRRARQPGRPQGILYQAHDVQIIVWAMTWGEILQICEGRLKFYQDQLNYKATESAGIEALRRYHNELLPPSLRAEPDDVCEDDNREADEELSEEEPHEELSAEEAR